MAPHDPSTDFSAFQDDVFSAVVSTVKAASSLASYDLDFERSSDPSFARELDKTNIRILQLASSLLKSAAAGSELAVPSLETAEDVEDRWPEVVEIADNMLEQADTCLDEYTGAIKQKHPDLPNARSDTSQRLSKNAQRSKIFSANSWASRNMVKPQLSFAVKPDPLDHSPFKPLLTSKPHAMVPLEESVFLTEIEDIYTGRKYSAYQHPYKKEIETSKYPPALYQKTEPIEYAPLEETPAVWVDTQEKLDQMLKELKEAEEIAVDLEHHDNRSFVGFVCLMQISTRKRDWIVDTLKLRVELQVLNEVFCDPKIIKVLHGAYMDIIWLQRDFGLYVVNLFDTYYAAKTLGFPGHGLAFLLKKYIDFDADKQYQLADWRLRPLPIEMLRYAQSDTHFLLHIFDHLRNALLSYPFPQPGAPESKLAHVLTGSRDTALRLYTREPYDAENGIGQFGWANILIKQNNHGLNPEQMAVFKALHQWRDTTARTEDEGHHYVLPKHQLFSLSKLMPDGAAEVLRAAGHPGDILKRRVDEVVAVIRRGRESQEATSWRELQAQMAAEAAALNALKTSSSADIAAARRIDIFRIASTPLPAVSNTLPNSTLPLRAGISTFWGAAEPEPRFVDPLITPDDSDEKATPSLVVPLPQLTAEIFVDPSAPSQTSEAPSAPKDPGARAEHEYIRPESRPSKSTEENVMIIRQVGGGRKRKHDATRSPSEEAVEGPSSTTTTPAVAQAEETVGSKGKLSKAERKAAKKARKETTAVAAQAVDEAQPSFEPFDYASAPSVLNGKGKGTADDGKRGRKDRKKKERLFEPFKGVGDAPKSLGRGQKERAGRTGTFK